MKAEELKSNKVGICCKLQIIINKEKETLRKKNSHALNIFITGKNSGHHLFIAKENDLHCSYIISYCLFHISINSNASASILICEMTGRMNYIQIQIL